MKKETGTKLRLKMTNKKTVEVFVIHCSHWQ
jgi:hypothetical protein